MSTSTNSVGDTVLTAEQIAQSASPCGTKAKSRICQSKDCGDHRSARRHSIDCGYCTKVHH